MRKDLTTEIEMQTYSMSYSYPANPPTALPYNWDGECHLTLNPTFYEPPEEQLSELPDRLFEEEDKNEPEELQSSLFSPMNCESLESQLSESLASVGSPSTETPSSLSTKSGSPESIDEQLDFILGSVKKQKKPKTGKKLYTEKKPKLMRKRKTSAQLEILQEEIKDNDTMDRARLKTLAEKSGLSVGQVYKWYWDFKRKQALV